MIDVSIIVPIYKTPEALLKKCINSIRFQTIKSIEIILIDDGSPDNCGIICNEFQKIDSRIVVIHQKNKGLCSARNTGFKASTGKWITFVDADDFIEKDFCKKTLCFGEKSNVQMVMCGVYRDYLKSSKPYSFYLQDQKVFLNNDCRYLREQLLHFNGNIACVYAKLIRRDFLVKNQLFHDEVLRQGEEGLEFNFRVFSKLTSAGFIKDSLYHYVYNKESISSNSTEKNNQYVISCYQKIKSYVIACDDSKELLPWFYNRMMYVVVTTVISGYFNPNQKMSMKKRISLFNNYINIQLVKETLESKSFFDISQKRRIVLLMIKCKFYMGLSILGKIRSWQKSHN